jgi:hypothetical protein
MAWRDAIDRYAIVALAVALASLSSAAPGEVRATSVACELSDLATFGSAQGTNQQIFGSLWLWNTGPLPCSLSAPADIAVLDSDTGVALPVTVTSRFDPAASIVLPPNQEVRIPLQWTPANYCGPRAADERVDVRLTTAAGQVYLFHRAQVGPGSCIDPSLPPPTFLLGPFARIQAHTLPAEMFYGPPMSPAVSSEHYQAGWNLVGLPEGTTVPDADGPAYTLEPNGGYGALDIQVTPASGGVGYWVYLNQPTDEVLPSAACTAVMRSLPPGALVMIGNPFLSPALLSGMDVAYGYEPTSGQHEQVTALPVGRGAFAYSAAGGMVTISPTASDC